MLSNAVFAQFPSFVAEVETRQALVGSPFNIEFSLKNAEGSGFTAPDFGGLQVIAGPSRSMQTTVINGRMSSSIGYVYSLVGTKPGTYIISPAKIRTGSKVLNTQPITIQIIQASKSAQNGKNYYIEATLSNEKAYIGQQVILTYKLYTRESIRNIEVVSSPKLEDFYKEYIANGDGNPKREIIHGQDYTTKVLGRIALFPIKKGLIKIDPTAYRLILGEDDPWGFSIPSMMGGRAEVIQTNSLQLNILDFPQPVPDGFSGAVGTFRAEFKDINKDYNLSDAINISLLIAGDGNMNNIQPKLFPQDSLFTISDARQAEPQKLSEEPVILKSRLYDYLLTPKKPGKALIKTEFCYLDPESNQYKFIRDSFEVQITSGKPRASVHIDELKPISGVVKLSKSSPFFLDQPINLLIMSFPFFLLAYFLFFKKGKEYFNQLKYTEHKKTPTIDGPSFTLDDLEKYALAALTKKYPELKDHQTLYAIKSYLSKDRSDPQKENFFVLISKWKCLNFQTTMIPQN
ncbi:MAG: protein BatD [Saprospiraceae bacterium]|nr:protein BatD [Candidatus Vicinibacter affinis]